MYFCFIDYAKAFDCVDHNKLWKILKEMARIPDHLTCLLRNLYTGQEATVRTGHGATDWFQIGKGVCQGCILSPCSFNLYAELAHWKRPWCSEGMGAGGEGDGQWWDGWMTSPMGWTWVWVKSGIWWWTGRPGVLQSMGSQRVRHCCAAEMNWIGYYKIMGLIPWSIQNILIVCLIFKSSLYMLTTRICASASLSVKYRLSWGFPELSCTLQ